MRFLTALSAIATVVVAGDATIGTNIGGWLVLEPWITPSLFYRFLGKTHSEGVGTDTWTFCEALGPTGMANQVMRAHFDSWITEDTIKDLAAREVELVRLPLGDWTLTPYGPYEGCMDGSTEKIDWLLDMCQKYDIKVLLDVHGMKGSQNGFDNSGQMQNVEWIDETHYKHWSTIAANWMGHWNFETESYDSIDWEQVQWAVDNVTNLMQRFGKHPAVWGMQPANEPWDKSDMDVLKDFYKRCREEVRKVNPAVKFVFHDAGHSTAEEWNQVWPDDDMENIIYDTHQYLAWNGRSDNINTYCDSYRGIFEGIADVKYPIMVGEWSLATDICAFWLGGFNDQHQMDAQFPCEWVYCPKSYLPDQYAAEFDRTAATLGPYGERQDSTVHYGQCATDSAFFNDDEVAELGACIAKVFDDYTVAQFIWTARNELEPKWSYVQAYDKGWLKTRGGQPQSFIE